jgi:hypothetical protein
MTLTTNEQNWYNTLARVNPSAAATYLKNIGYWSSPAGVAQKAQITALQVQHIQPSGASFVPGAKVAASTKVDEKGNMIVAAKPVVATKPAPVLTKPLAATPTLTVGVAPRPVGPVPSTPISSMKNPPSAPITPLPVATAPIAPGTVSAVQSSVTSLLDSPWIWLIGAGVVLLFVLKGGGGRR